MDATQSQVSQTAGGNYDTPVGVGGTINNNTGQLLPSTSTGTSSGAPTTPVSQTQDAGKINTQLSGQTTGTVFPPPPKAPTQSTSNNTSVPNPIATPQDIISQGNAQTPGEKTNQNLLEKVAALIGQKQSQTGLTNTAEAAAGVPALTKTVNDLNTQLEGLNNQALNLQNQIQKGGSMQNSYIESVRNGTDIFSAHSGYESSLRENQIQQSAIASQALTLKSAIYGAQGQLSLAKDAADKAAQAQFEDQQNQIDYQNALIAANLPQMNKEEKNQALLVQTQLADRQTQINQAIDDKKTIVALAVQAMTNNPGNAAVQYAAQQALAESNKQQPDLKTALGLVGQYQKDPLQTALQVQQLIAARNANAFSASSSALAPYVKTSYDGSQYVDVSTLSPTEKLKYTQLAASQGLKVVQTPADADKVSHIAVAKSNLNDIMNSFNSVPTEKDLPAAQGITNSIKGFFGNADIKAYQNYRTSAINTLQALAGGQGSGLRINQAEVNAAVKDIPVLTGPNADTPAQAQKKIDNLNGQLDKWQVQILGGGNTAAKDSGAGTIRVRIGNQTGTIDASQFDPKTMTKL